MASDPVPVLTDNVVSLHARQFSKPAPSGVLGVLVEEAKKTLTPALEETFRRADDDLFRRSEQDRDFFDGLRELRRRQPMISRQFLEKVSQALTTPMKKVSEGQSEVSSLSLGELSLVDEGELEETLAISRMVAAADQAYAGDLVALRHRFAVLAGGCDPEKVELPLRPQVIAEAFEQCLKEWPLLTLPLKIVLYKHFERHVMVALGEVLGTANIKLVEAGILPSFSPHVSNRTSSQPPRSEPVEETLVAPPLAGSLPGDWGQLNSLLSTRRQVVTHGAVVAPRPSANLQELGEALLAFRELQGMFGSSAEVQAIAPEQVKVRLLEKIHEKTAGQKGLGVHEDTIDAVGMLFDHILKDPNLPASMQVLLSRLQLPFIKVAVLEPDLFSQPNHPARRLLDLMGETAKGWSVEADKDRQVVSKMEAVVETINRGFVDDNKVFEGQLLAFQGFLADLSRRQSVAEKRSEEIAQNKDRMEVAQSVVTSAVVERTAGKPLPEWARSLILRDWTGYMILVVRKDGETSSAFRNALFFVEKIVGAAEAQSEASKRALATVMPSLLHQLREGLGTVGIGPSGIEAAEKNLTDYLEACAGLGQPKAMPAMFTVESQKAELAVPKPKPEKKWMDQAAAMAIGDWVEFRDDGGKTARGKVAWLSGFSGRILFVTISGTRLAERSTEEVAWMLQRGSARLIENKPLFERAVGSILQKLKG